LTDTSQHVEIHPIVGRLATIGRRYARTTPLADKLVESQQELWRFIKFALVGISGTIVDFTTLNIVHLLFGASLFVSNSISFSIAVVNNFIWNRLWTFPESRARPFSTQLLQFGAVNVVGLVINQTVFLTLNHYVFRPWLGELGYNVAKACAIIVVLFWNFGINRIWTYKGIR
jgi:putative flippase GtrA